MRLAVIGDSITTGYGVPPESGFAALLESRDLPGQVLKLGFNGATVRRWLPGGPYHDTLTELRAFGPTDVVLPFGMNEWYICRRPTDFTQHLVSLASEILGLVPGARLTLWHYHPGGIPQDPRVCDIQPCSPQAPPPTWASYGAAMAEAARTVRAQYLDSAALPAPWPSLLQNDKAHPNIVGHLVLYLHLRCQLGLGARP